VKGLTGGEHRNFYAPYTSEYNGYNSFIGIGGDYLGDIDGEENTGAGGAGYYDNKNVNRVGKGGNGGCIIEYEGSEKLEVYAEGYLYIPAGKNILSFIIYDNQSGSRNIDIEFESGIYSISYIIEYIKANLNLSTIANVTNVDSKLVIKMGFEWSIDTGKSSGDLLIDLGILNSDVYQNGRIKKATLVNGTYELPFTNQITSICNLTFFNSNQIFG
jgi:hypothetical protein